MIKTWKTLVDDNVKPGKGFDLMLKKMLIIVATTTYSPFFLADENRETEKIVELYCEGMDWASNRVKHISVSIDSGMKSISILDPLRDEPRVLVLDETPTQYKASGNYSQGYINVEKEHITFDASHRQYCEDKERCDLYISYATEFTLNRQTGAFEYLVVEEVREERSDSLIATLNDWGIFRAAKCRQVQQQY